MDSGNEFENAFSPFGVEEFLDAPLDGDFGYEAEWTNSEMVEMAMAAEALGNEMGQEAGTADHPTAQRLSSVINPANGAVAAASVAPAAKTVAVKIIFLADGRFCFVDLPDRCSSSLARRYILQAAKTSFMLGNAGLSTAIIQDDLMERPICPDSTEIFFVPGTTVSLTIPGQMAQTTAAAAVVPITIEGFGEVPTEESLRQDKSLRHDFVVRAVGFLTSVKNVRQIDIGLKQSLVSGILSLKYIKAKTTPQEETAVTVRNKLLETSNPAFKAVWERGSKSGLPAAVWDISSTTFIHARLTHFVRHGHDVKDYVAGSELLESLNSSRRKDGLAANTTRKRLPDVDMAQLKGKCSKMKREWERGDGFYDPTTEKGFIGAADKTQAEAEGEQARRLRITHAPPAPAQHIVRV